MPSKPLDEALRLLTYGVYIITTAREGEEAALLTEWLSQVSLQPPTLALSVPPNVPAARMLASGAPFVVNILKAGQKTLAEDFAATEVESRPLQAHPTERAGNGCPYLSEALAIIECEPGATYEVGTGAVLVTGVAIEARLLHEGQPLTLRQTGFDVLERRKTL